MNIKWAPDYSTFIDLDKYGRYSPTWTPNDDGVGGYFVVGENEGGAGTVLRPFGNEQDTKPSYQDLKNAGLWKLGDLNSDTWKFLQSSELRGAGGTDIRSDPSKLLNKLISFGALPSDPYLRPQAESQLREMLTGLNPEFINQAVPATSQYLQTYNDSIDDSFTMRDALGADGFGGLIFNTPIGIALAAMTGGATSAAWGAAGGAGAAAAGGAAGGAVLGAGRAGVNGGNLFEGAVKGGISGGLGAGAGDLISDAVSGLGGLDSGGFVDNFDMLQDPSIMYQSPEMLNMPLPEGGFTGGALDMSSLPAMEGPGAFDQFGSWGAPDSGTTIYSGDANNPFPDDSAGAFDQFGSAVSPTSDETIFGGSLDNPFGGNMDEFSFLDDLINDPGGSFDFGDLGVGGDTSFFSDPSGGFVDNWDMLQDPFNTYQNPEVLDMPLPNGGVTGGGGGFLDSLTSGGRSLLQRFLGGRGGASAGGTAGGASTGTGAQRLARILRGEGSLEDILGLGGAVAPSLLSMYGLNKQSQTMADVARQQQAAEQSRYQDLVSREQARYQDVTQREDARLGDLISRDQTRFNTLQGREDAAIARQRGDIDYGRSVGAPYRDQLAGLYSNPDSFLTSAAVTGPNDQATNSLARALSIKGNPAGNPAAMAEIQKYSADNLARLLGQEKDRLAQAGGLSQFNAAGATVPGIGSGLSGSVPTPGSLFSGSASAGSGIGTSGGLEALMGSAQARARQFGDAGRGLSSLLSLT